MIDTSTINTSINRANSIVITKNDQ